MNEKTNKNKKLLQSVRSVGTIKPFFDVKQQNFLPPQLNILGTGVWIDGGVFITCAHVVQNLLSQPLELGGMLVVGGNNSEYFKATISILDIEHDLTILQISDKNFHNNQKDIALKINNEKEMVGDDVCFAGYPLGNQLLDEKHTPIFSKGVVAQTSSEFNKIRKEIKISGSIEGGFSGSPVVNSKNELVGIISSHPNETKNIFNIITWEHVIKLVELEKS